MKVLFIGGTGRLSKDVAKLASDRGFDVYLFTRGTKNRTVFIDQRYHMLYGDIRNVEKSKQVLNGLFFDVVIDFLTYNIEQLDNILNILNKKYNQYIFISTATVYKRVNYDELITEEKTQTGNVNWSYAYNKFLCEEKIKRYFVNKNETYTIIRPGVTYGNTRIPYPIVPSDTQKEYSFIYRILKGKSIPVFDEGKTETTLTNTKDFAKGVVGLMGNEKAYEEAFHITSDEEVTWGDVLSNLEDIMNVKINRLFVTQKEIYNVIPYYKDILIGDKGNRTRFDNSKICKVVPGLTFNISLYEGLKETIAFYKQNPNLQMIDFYWMGCLDKLASVHGFSEQRLYFDNVYDYTSYFRGRYYLIDSIYKSLRYVKRKLK